MCRSALAIAQGQGVSTLGEYQLTGKSLKSMDQYFPALSLKPRWLGDLIGRTRHCYVIVQTLSPARVA
jgi:hypothetical protein